MEELWWSSYLCDVILNIIYSLYNKYLQMAPTPGIHYSKHTAFSCSSKSLYTNTHKKCIPYQTLIFSMRTTHFFTTMSGSKNQAILAKIILIQTRMMSMMTQKYLNMLMWCYVCFTTSSVQSAARSKRSQDEMKFSFLLLLDPLRAKHFVHSRNWRMYYKSLDHVHKKLCESGIPCVALQYQ